MGNKRKARTAANGNDGAADGSTDVSKKMVFIRNLPSTTTNQDLETFFGEIGPTRRCFIVAEKGSQQCRGIGYVQFALEEDAQRAVKEFTGKRFAKSDKRIVVQLARRRQREGKAPGGERQEDGEDEEPQAADVDIDEFVKQSAAEAKRHAVPDSKLVKIKTEPEDEPPKQAKSKAPAAVIKKEQIKQEPVERTAPAAADKTSKRLSAAATAVVDEDSDADVVIIKPEPDPVAAKRVARLAKLEPPSSAAAAVIDEPTEPPKKKQKKNKDFRKCRLIIRNLSFQAKADDLRAAFEPYGKLVDVSVPTKPDGKMRGFGFVQFSNVNEATKAIAGVNMKEIKGRPVAVDWALAKDVYEEQKSHLPEAQPPVAGEEAEESGDDDAEDESEPDDDEDNAAAIKQEDDEGGSADGDEDSEARSEGSDEDDEAASDEDEEPAEDEPDEDVRVGSTLFLRNLSFNSTREHIFDKFKEFGFLKSVYVVMDHEKNRPRGSAFVTFAKKTGADAALSAAYERLVPDPEYAGNMESNIVLDGRALIIARAVDKNTAQTLQSSAAASGKKTKAKQDKRNLYLANEGVITREMAAAAGLSAAEIEKRERAQREKKMKLSNPNFFVSKTRLSVRNLPRDVSEARLKLVFKKAAKLPNSDTKPVVKQAKLLRDQNKKDKDALQSKGIAFVEFTEHEHALAALRALNNSPEPFGAAHRPIIEFAIENVLAVRKHQQREKQRLQKAQKAAANGAQGADAADSGASDKATRKAQKSAARRAAKKAAKQAANASGAEAGAVSGGSATPAKNAAKSANAAKAAKSARGAKPTTRQQERPFSVQPSGRKRAAPSAASSDAALDALASGGVSEFSPAQQGQKGVKPPKKPRREDADDRNFDRLVSEYTAQFTPRTDSKKWFED